MFKFIIITGALLAVPAVAQDGSGKQASNFILGHGALAPQTASADYPPGHQVDGSNVRLPASSSEKPEARASERK